MFFITILINRPSYQHRTYFKDELSFRLNLLLGLFNKRFFKIKDFFLGCQSYREYPLMMCSLHKVLKIYDLQISRSLYRVLKVVRDLYFLCQIGMKSTCFLLILT